MPTDRCMHICVTRMFARRLRSEDDDTVVTSRQYALGSLLGGVATTTTTNVRDWRWACMHAWACICGRGYALRSLAAQGDHTILPSQRPPAMHLHKPACHPTKWNLPCHDGIFHAMMEAA